MKFASCKRVRFADGNASPGHDDAVAATRRILALERQCAESRDKANALAQLQHTFVAMASVDDPTEILTTMLCAARFPLGFSRAILFSVEREAGIVARFQIDSSDVVETSAMEPDLRAGSAFLSILRERLPVVVGAAHDLSAPIVDVRSWYIASALLSGRDATNILYVDGHPSKQIREDDATLVQALTTISTVMYERALAFKRATELASRDPLTGLLNRRAFNDRLARRLDRALDVNGTVTYVLIDVDDFKKINDQHGHPFGDAVLRRIAGTLTQHSREQDLVGRYAGDEFNLLLDDIDSASAHALIARLSATLRDEGLQCSLGAARFPDDAPNAARLLEAADVALYRAKRAGKGTFAFYGDAYDAIPS